MRRYWFETMSLWMIVWLPEKNLAQRKEVCYPVIGCFDLEPPWTTIWRPVPIPQSPDEIAVKFYIMTRNTNHKTSIDDWKVTLTSEYEPTMESLQKLDYRSERSMTVMHIHGMCQNAKKRWNREKEMANAYLSRQDVNIIFVEWDSHLNNRGYLQCVSNTRIAAAVTAKFIENLTHMSGLTANQIHLIGFSLGAHVAGYIGKIIPNIYRITALDAAQPLFEDGDPIIRLHHTDAQYVDALHTNAKSFFKAFGLGFIKPIGDVDFYFNEGAYQPGCSKPKGGLKGLFSWYPKEIFSQIVRVVCRCSHVRAMRYWTEALGSRTCTMWGFSQYFPLGLSNEIMQETWANNYLPVGLDTFTNKIVGTFHVITNDKEPFCISTSEDQGGQSSSLVPRDKISYQKEKTEEELYESTSEEF